MLCWVQWFVVPSPLGNTIATTRQVGAEYDRLQLWGLRPFNNFQSPKTE